jgi:hypothetical protein
MSLLIVVSLSTRRLKRTVSNGRHERISVDTPSCRRRVRARLPIMLHDAGVWFDITCEPDVVAELEVRFATLSKRKRQNEEKVAHNEA